MKTVLTFIAVGLAHFAGFSADSQFQRILDQYMSVKDALVSDNPVMASEQALILLNKSDSLPAFEKKTKLMTAVNTIATTTKIEKQRTAFAIVSDIFWELVQAAPGLDKTVYQHYCPMKKVY